MELWVYVTECMASSKKAALALTMVDKTTFTSRFEFPSLQQLHFKYAADVQRALSYFQAIGVAGKTTRTIRSAEDYKKVKKLTLTLSDQLKAEQCVPLLKHLTGLTHLKIHLPEEYSAASLSRLLEAAARKLQQLSIIKPPQLSKVEDRLPDTLWECRTLTTLRVEGLYIDSISEKIGQLNQLTSLELKNLHKLQCLPPELFHLPNLDELVLENIGSKNSATELFNGLECAVQLKDKLKTLKLSNVKNFTPSPSLWNLTNLEELVLDRIELVIPEEMGQLTALKCLTLRDLEAVEELPDALWSLSKLEYLELDYLEDVTKISDKITQLTALTTLSIDLPSLEKAPKEIGQLQKLNSLSIARYHPDIWPKSLWELSHLEHLKLHTFKANVSIPNQISCFTNLRSLTLNYAYGNIDFVQSLSKLERLTLKEIMDATLPRAVVSLTSLQSLSLYDMPHLKTLPVELSCLPHLQKIVVDEKIKKRMQQVIAPELTKKLVVE